MLRIACSLVCLTAFLSSPVLAQSATQGAGFFSSIDVGASFRKGASGATRGGADFEGTVRDVDFDPAVTIGGRFGYRTSSAWSFFASYDHVRGDVAWRGEFARTQDSLFSGNARSNVILANVAFRGMLASRTSIAASLGAGISRNKLTNVIETPITGIPPGVFAEVSSDTSTSFAARAALDIEHRITDALSIGARAGVDYYGDFSTGTSRTVVQPGRPLLIGAIGPYEIKDVWGGTIGGFVQVRF